MSVQWHQWVLEGTCGEAAGLEALRMDYPRLLDGSKRLLGLGKETRSFTNEPPSSPRA